MAHSKYGHPQINVVKDGKIICTKCELWKDPSEFRDCARMKRKKRSSCTECERSRSKEWFQGLSEEQRQERRERRRDGGAERQRQYRKDRPDVSKFATIKYRYGVTREQWEAQYERQGGVCAVSGCGSEATHLDHDHSCCPDVGSGRNRACGKCFRGILCAPCNYALGHVQDNPTILRGLADYVELNQRLRDTL